jgi:hypothetical protein
MDDKEGIKYRGKMTLNLFRGEALIDQRIVENTLLDVGKTWLIVRTFDDHGSASVSGTAAHYFYVGTTASGGAAAAGDTTGDITWANGGQEGFTYQTGATVGQMSGTATFVSATANGAITEAGIFAGVPVNAPTTGDGAFICRSLFAAINKTANDTLQIKWDVSFS